MALRKAGLGGWRCVSEASSKVSGAFFLDVLLLHTSLPECCRLPPLLHHHLHLRSRFLHMVLICTTQVGGTEWACWDAKFVHELHQGLLAAVEDNNGLTYCTLHGGERAELCLRSTKPHKGIETLIAILCGS